MAVRDYRPYSHPDEIHMVAGDIHAASNPPAGFDSDLESALDRIARQDVSLTGGPRGK